MDQYFVSMKMKYLNSTQKHKRLNLLPDIKLWTIYVKYQIFLDSFIMQLQAGMEMYGPMIFEQVWKAKP